MLLHSHKKKNMRMFYILYISHSFMHLTFCLLVLSADNLCLQFRPRSGPTKCQTWSVPKLKEFKKKKIDFEKNQ